MPPLRTIFGFGFGLGLAITLAACAEPGALRAPAHGPLMEQPASADPTPAYAQPDPSPHAEPPQDPAAPPSARGP